MLAPGWVESLSYNICIGAALRKMESASTIVANGILGEIEILLSEERCVEL